MPIQRLTTHASAYRAFAYGVILACSTQVLADTSPWNGSYAAEGNCYCTGEQSRNIDSQIVPTPVGGQSVKQVCDRLAAGPTLQKVNGKFNFTVYPDAQCGNGPFSDSKTVENEQCLGHLGVSGEDCSIRGPRWDLTDAYSTDNQNKVIVFGGSRYIKPPVKNTSSAKIKKQSSTNASVAKIARTRTGSKKLHRQAQLPAVPETREQIRARQLVHLAAARKRAEIAESAELSTTQKSVEFVPAKPDESKKASVESVAETVNTPAVTKDVPAAAAALKVPTQLNFADPDFNYFEAAPVAFDFGGGGLSIAASKSGNGRAHYVLRAAAADTYREASIGIGMFFKPAQVKRTTLLVRTGLEYGLFNFQNNAVSADLSDTGAFVELAARVVLTRKFDLQSGLSYNSFFEGDVVSYGAAFYQLTTKLDLTAKAEMGDNDLFGFGIRYHY